jgi:hypothetical protein
MWPAHMRGREITLYIYRYYDTTRIKKFYQYDPTKETRGKYHVSNKYRIDKLHKLVKNPSLEFPEFYGSNPFTEMDLSPEDEHPWAFYREFIRKAEKILSANNIRSNSCAHGDKWLGGKYASLRNETFVMIGKDFIYPPNQCGYNGCKYKDDVFRKLKGWNKWLIKKRDKKKLNKK